MKLPTNYLENLSSSTYKEYMKILPSLRKTNTHAVTTLIFTVVAIIVFGAFAISPTISTIVELQKQLQDSQYVHEQLQTKINNLNHLQVQYTAMSSDIPILYDALPKNPEATLLVAQMETLLHQTKLQVSAFHIEAVPLAPLAQTQDTASSFQFSLQVQGSYQDMLTFTSSLAQLTRIVTIHSLTITKDKQNNILLLSIQGRGYYKT